MKASVIAILFLALATGALSGFARCRLEAYCVGSTTDSIVTTTQAITATEYVRSKCTSLSSGNVFCFVDIYSSSGAFTIFVKQDTGASPSEIFELAINPTTCNMLEEAQSAGGPNDISLSVGHTTSATHANIDYVCTVLSLKEVIV